MTYRVVVPSRSGTASYPPSGHPDYTKQQAMDLLTKLHERFPCEDGDPLEPWAESETERFTYHDRSQT